MAVSNVSQPPRPAAELRWLVDDVIAPWRAETEERPPFSPSELFIMALAEQGRPLDRREVFLWIFNTFGYHRVRGMPRLWYELETRRGHRGRTISSWKVDNIEDWKGSPGPNFLDVVLDYHVPIHAVLGKHDAIENGTRWEVNVQEATLLLRSRFKACERTRAFPFLRLPAEIRKKVYEMAFRYPRSGLVINSHGTDRSGMVYSRTRDFGVDLSARLQLDRPRLRAVLPQIPNVGCHQMLEVGKLSDVLNCLLVNRQFHEEARSVFLAINTFVFENASHLRSVLRKMPGRDRDRVERVAFDYVPEVVAYVSLKESFAIMSTMKSLNWLQISLWQRWWIARTIGHWHGDPCIEDKMQFNRAAKIGDKVQVVLRGNYPETIEEQIRSDPIEDESEEEERVSLEPADALRLRPEKASSVKSMLRFLRSHLWTRKARFSTCRLDAHGSSFEHSVIADRKPPKRYL